VNPSLLTLLSTYILFYQRLVVNQTIKKLVKYWTISSLIGLILYWWNIFVYVSAVCGQPECDFSKRLYSWAAHTSTCGVLFYFALLTSVTIRICVLFEQETNVFSQRRSQDCFFGALVLKRFSKRKKKSKTHKSALLVLWKGVINFPLQSLDNQYFCQKEKYWLTKFEELFSKKNREKYSPHLKPPRNLKIFEICFVSSCSNELNPCGENFWITFTSLENVP